MITSIIVAAVTLTVICFFFLIMGLVLECDDTVNTFGGAIIVLIVNMIILSTIVDNQLEIPLKCGLAEYDTTGEVVFESRQVADMYEGLTGNTVNVIADDNAPVKDKTCEK